MRTRYLGMGLAGLLAAAVLSLPTPGLAADTCSLSGVYPFSTLADPGTTTQALGTMTFTPGSSCAVSGTVAITGSFKSVGGTETPFSLTGGYSVDSTGRMTTTIAGDINIWGQVALQGSPARLLPFVGAFTGGLMLAGVAANEDPTLCPRDSVRSGTICIDTYEASVWQIPPGNTAVIAKIKNGTVTLAELNAAGFQRGTASDDYGAGCPDTGNGCKDFYAVSIPGVTPSRFLTKFQAGAAARNSGKRLPTSQEWQDAALGTPDTGGADNGTTNCNTGSTVAAAATGSRSGCVSDVGAFDMVGNLWEWVADWVPLSTACPGWGGFSDDLMCLAGADSAVGPGALFRGGDFFSGAGAGVFAVSGSSAPSNASSNVGFRAAR
jgi:hypothetical protein